MLEWLNQNVGADWATYIGTLLALITIFYGSNKIYKNFITKKSNSSINIKGGNNSINIQAGRDVKGNQVSKNDS